jgi:peptidoglycan/xylan/chitin deacetylase (PgdA/CDA1 family)
MIDTIPILLYHSVPDDYAQATDRLSVSADLFADHMQAVVESQRVPVTIGEIAAALGGKGELPERPVAITFDDGYDNTLHAVKLVTERELRATVYVTTGHIDADSMISTEHLLALARQTDVVELGAHSVTHPHLDELSAAEINREVCVSKVSLEHLLRRPVETFAYPFGSYDQRVIQAVIGAGFKSAVAVKNALSHSGDDPWAIARWTVRRSTPPEQLALVLAGAGARRAWHGERLRTRGYRGARRLTRRVRLVAGK